MSQLFKEVLNSLPDIDHVNKIKLYDEDGNFVDDIENLQGTQGSLKVYFYLYKNFKELNLEAAQKGLSLFSEHTAEARKKPGNHPNIDRLIDIVQTNNILRIETILL
tara:strand:+ start:98 stop:418 length:321 start_codon:yes stop_codon:yes gene_type:complete